MPDKVLAQIHRRVDFLDFLRPGEKDIHAFAEKQARAPAADASQPAEWHTGERRLG